MALRAVLGCLLLVAFGAGSAQAGVRITEKTRTYSISGGSGAALLEAMDRRGPKHGFLTRAIAQTSYSVSWKIEWAETRSACRVRQVDGHLDITYTYPKPAEAMPAELRKRWNGFISGVRVHEEHHGVLARQMVAAAERSMSRVSIRNDRGCVRAKREVKRRMAAIYADYEKRQIAFDAREHRDGGKVEGLISALVRGRR